MTGYTKNVKSMKYKKRRCLVFLLSIPIFIFMSHKVDMNNTGLLSNNYKLPIRREISEGKLDAYRKMLSETADSKGVVILALIDQGFVDMAVNFWETSILPFDIKNMLFVSLSRKACEILLPLDIPCHVYEDFTGGKADSAYMSPIFLKKMNTRTQFILDALSWNFTVLNTDTDVIFFKSPLGYFKCLDCHLEILEDGVKNLLNAGFVYLRPTKITAEVYQRMAAIARKNPKSEDQAILNKVIKSNLKGRIKFKLLNANEFMCGKKYYEEGKRYFADTAAPCKTCVVVHNNWIVTKAAKIYRQKEMLQWVYDGAKYYSDPNRKYLTYNNAMTFKDDKQAKEEDKQALINAFAIGHILNRTVILPRLHCKSNYCPWNSRFYISHIDDSFAGKYRESTFLNHPKVPDRVKKNIWRTYLIKSTKYSNQGLNTSANVTVKEPQSITKGATSEEVKSWFGDSQASVLKFHSLYGAFQGFTNSSEQLAFNALLKNAFKGAVYRQY